MSLSFSFFFFFNDTATTEIYTLSLHDALPISSFRCAARSSRTRAARSTDSDRPGGRCVPPRGGPCGSPRRRPPRDRKSTRLNSSHLVISYAVFCLKKKKKNTH